MREANLELVLNAFGVDEMAACKLVGERVCLLVTCYLLHYPADPQHSNDKIVIFTGFLTPDDISFRVFCEKDFGLFLLFFLLRLNALTL